MRLFNTIHIQTPESIELEFVLAGVGNRAFALLIDYIIFNLSLLTLFFLGWFAVYSLQSNDALGYFDLTSQWIVALFALALFALYVGYFVAFEVLWQGQTPGKRWVKIRVIRDNAQPIGLFQATLRALARPIDDILFIGFLCILLHHREKRLGDWLAGTLVVQAEDPKASQLNTSETAQALMADLLAQADLSQLQPDDFALVREYLQRRSHLTPAARITLGDRQAERIKDRLKLEPGTWDIDADLLLETVYLAYQNGLSRYR